MGLGYQLRLAICKLRDLGEGDEPRFISAAFWSRGRKRCVLEEAGQGERPVHSTSSADTGLLSPLPFPSTSTGFVRVAPVPHILCLWPWVRFLMLEKQWTLPSLWSQTWGWVLPLPLRLTAQPL